MRTLTLYDSMIGNESHDIEVHKTIEPIVKFLPHMLDVMGVFKGRTGVQERNALFSLKVCDEFPQQTNG